MSTRHETRAFVRAAFNHAQTLTPTMDFGSIHLDAPFDGVVVTKDTEMSGKDSLSFSFGPCVETSDVCDMVDMSRLNVIECANGALVIDASDAGKAWDLRNPTPTGFKGDPFAEVGL